MCKTDSGVGGAEGEKRKTGGESACAGWSQSPALNNDGHVRHAEHSFSMPASTQFTRLRASITGVASD